MNSETETKQELNFWDEFGHRSGHNRDVAGETDPYAMEFVYGTRNLVLLEIGRVHLTREAA